MKNSKFFIVLKSLNRKEMTRFWEFCHSPYHNKHKGVIKLIDLCQQIYPNFEHKKCRKEYIYQVLFPNSTYSPNKLALVFTYTYRQLEQFLILEQKQNNDLSAGLLLLQQLRKRKLYKQYESQQKKYARELDTASTRDIQYLQTLVEAKREADFYFTETSGRRKDSHLDDQQRFLDQHFIAEKLSLALEMHVRKHILNVDYSNPLLEAILDEIQQNPAEYLNTPSIQTYYALYLLLNKETKALYEEAKKILLKNQHFFSREEQLNLYNYMQNFCIKKINKNNAYFLQALFELFKDLLDNDLLIEDGYLSEWYYKNIVTTALRLQENEWAFQFIEKYKERLQPTRQKNAYHFNLASYYYQKGAFDKVLDLLLSVNYTDIRYSLGARALLLRTYFDLEEYEALSSLITAFGQYIRRNKLMATSRRLGYHNLFKYTGKIARIKENQAYWDKEKVASELAKTEAEILHQDAFFNKQWLLDRIHLMN